MVKQVHTGSSPVQIIINMKKNFSYFPDSFSMSYFFVFNTVVSLYSLWWSPFILLCWLIFVTLFLKYFDKLNRKYLIVTWVPIFILWYLILMIDLGGHSPLIIGPGYTEELLAKAFSNDLIFERISVPTILYLHFLSSFLGFPVFIPVVFNIYI